MKWDIVDGREVKKLCADGRLASAVVIGQPGGFAVLLKYGENTKLLGTQGTCHIRLWRNLNTVTAFIRERLGFQRFEIDMTLFDLDAVKRSRPDTAVHLRKLHKAGRP